MPLPAQMHADQPLVSVVMPSYNHSAYVREAIASVVAQTYPELELIIIDDGSEDDTPQVIEAILAENQREMRVVFLRQENAGLCTTLNRALAYCQGEFVQFLASDDAYLPEKTARCVEELRAAAPDVAAVYCDGYIFDEKSRRRDVYSKRYPVPIGRNMHRELLIANWLPAMGLCYRRGDLEALGGFDPNLNFEDWDFLLRLTRTRKILRIPDRLFLYRVHSGNMTKNSATIQETMRALAGKHPDLGAYVQFKEDFRRAPTMTLSRSLGQIDLIFRKLCRKILTDRDVQGETLPRALMSALGLFFHRLTVEVRSFLYRLSGLNLGARCKIDGKIRVSGNKSNLTIGVGVVFEGDAEFILPRGVGVGRVEISDGCIVAPGAVFHCMAGDMILGRSCYVGRNAILQSNGNLRIGDWTLIAGQAGIYASNHVTSESDQPFWRQGNRFVGISIGENCWIGHGAVVADGSEIGANSIVGPNSVVRGIHEAGSRLI